MAREGYVVYTADKIKNRKKRAKRYRIIILVSVIFLMGLFVVLSLAYNGGSFTVTLDPNFQLDSGLAIYTEKEVHKHVRKLYAAELKFMDNISIDWLPKNYQDFTGGSHNGDNYIAYTFYVDNQGAEIQDYWYKVTIEDVIKNVDEAIRIMIVINDEATVYAKANPLTGSAEKGTELFYKNDIPVLKNRPKLKPGEIDKVTVFIWLEGDDPECVDNILGGEIKISMNITDEHFDEETRQYIEIQKENEAVNAEIIDESSTESNNETIE